MPFGDLLRKTRKASHKTLGNLADFLKVSVAYLSDVELGNRAPLAAEKIREVAQFLQVPSEPLLIAAAEKRGRFELDARGATPRALEVGAALMRGWPTLGAEELEKIADVIERRSPAKERG